ncbi:DNA-binding transcriptional LysR family regulator [Rhizobium sp. BK275]|nr:DNA-binding transcriptional LysR family regulator [Rhizobium sp. BK275]MBB3406219.1 DNA-binding transcriptional LysR family regulator [Rhizobium sp. BK316]
MSAGVKSEIDIEDLRGEKIISFPRQSLPYSERHFAKKFEEHDLTDDVSYTRDDTFSLMSLVSAGLGVGFVPEWTQDLSNRGFDLKKVRGIDFRIGLVVAWIGRIRPPRATASSISHDRGAAGQVR